MQETTQKTAQENAQKTMQKTTQETTSQRIQKINWLYLLSYIFAPIIICAICFALSAAFFPKGTGAVILIMVPSLLSVIWWAFGGSFIFKRKTKEFEKNLDNQGFTRNQTFYGRGKTVIVDLKKGDIAFLFFWNPTKTYILPATRVEKAWVDDGKSGSSVFAGSSRVSFLFTIDGIKTRVDTFTSNQRLTMENKHILRGISKANTMAQMIKDAKETSEKLQKSKKDTKNSAEKSETPKKDSKTEKKSEKSEKSQSSD